MKQIKNQFRKSTDYDGLKGKLISLFLYLFPLNYLVLHVN